MSLAPLKLYSFRQQDPGPALQPEEADKTKPESQSESQDSGRNKAEVRITKIYQHIDPGVNLSDQIRKNLEENREPMKVQSTQAPETDRKPLSQILLGDTKLHDAVEKSPFVVKLRENRATKEEYMQYLVNLKYGLQTLETYLDELAGRTWMKPLNLKPLYRLESLHRDIKELGVKPCKPSQLVLEQNHMKHFMDLNNERPHLLVAHAAMRYLAILFGGQLRAERLKTMWGESAPLHLYQFSRDPHTLCGEFLQQLDAFGEKLYKLKYQQFLAEIKIAWEFAGDILDNDIRNISRT